MIKRIIFDIDNTLIEWKSCYNELVIQKTLEDLQIPYTQELFKKINFVLENSDTLFSYSSQEEIVKKIREETNFPIPQNWLTLYFQNTITLATPEELPSEEVQTLQYLFKKYELVCLTNWFVKPQRDRLEKAQILSFFQTVYGSENSPNKPHPKAFQVAKGSHQPEECIMIGDNLRADIQGAISVGMKAIYFNPNHHQLPFSCKEIHSWQELQTLL